MKNILVIVGHPDQQSFCTELANAYLKGAQGSSAVIKSLHLGALDFDPVLWQGYNKRQNLEEDLQKAQKDIEWAEHIVFVYPIWWGAMPALLKGFFDRVFLPGFAFKYRDNSSLWDKLLAGRTAHLMVTMDTPPWYYRFIYHRPAYHQMKRTILGFCGIQTKKVTEYAAIRGSTDAQRQRWLAQAEQLGRVGA